MTDAVPHGSCSPTRSPGRTPCCRSLAVSAAAARSTASRVSTLPSAAMSAASVPPRGSGLPPGTSATIGVIRKGQEKSFNIMLGNLPDQREANANPETPRQKGTSVPRLGVSVAPAADGVIVTGVDPDGLAAEQGIKSGDVILQVSGKRVGTAVDLRNVIEAAQKAGKHTVLMRVKSAEGIKFDSPYQAMPQLRFSAAFLTDPSGARIELTEGLAH